MRRAGKREAFIGNGRREVFLCGAVSSRREDEARPQGFINEGLRIGKHSSRIVIISDQEILSSHSLNFLLMIINPSPIASLRIFRSPLLGIGGLLLCALAAACAEPVPQPFLFFNFNEGGGSSTISTNSSQVSELLFSDPSKGEVSLFGSSGSGLNGKPGDYALDIGSTTAAMGVAGASGGVASLSTKRILPGPLASFTVAGWFKAASMIDGGARLMEYKDPLGNGFILMTGKAALVLGVNKGVSVATPGATGPYSQVDSWVFFAVTYDAMKTSDNVVFYSGTDTAEPVVVTVASAESGPTLPHNQYGSLTIGNNGDGIRPFHGLLDNIALYTSPDDSSGALTEEQIKQFYKVSQESALGPATPPATQPAKPPQSSSVRPSQPLTAAVPIPKGSYQIALIGDSTVCNYPPDSLLRGWGQMLPEFLVPGTKILNEARGGLSSKTFPRPQWEKILQSKPEFVFIQFGHNDSHAPDRPESTNAATDYKDNLRKYISEARAAGITPVLVTPPHRRVFYSGKLNTEMQAYAESMKQVGVETATPVIDLYALSGTLLESLGEVGSTSITVNAGASTEPGAKEDRTHFSEEGARRLAGLLSGTFSQTDPRLGKLLKAP